jgi:hypothetical protein
VKTPRPAIRLLGREPEAVAPFRTRRDEQRAAAAAAASDLERSRAALRGRARARRMIEDGRPGEVVVAVAHTGGKSGTPAPPKSRPLR